MNLEGLVPGPIELDAKDRDRLRADLVRHAQTDAFPPRRSARPARRRRGRWAVAIAASAAVLGAAAVLVVVPDGRRVAVAGPLEGAAAASDRSAGLVVATGSVGVTSLPAGQFLYVEEEVADRVRTGLRPDLDYLQPEAVMTWTRGDGSGVSVTRDLSPVFDSSADRARAAAAGLVRPPGGAQTRPLPATGGSGPAIASRDYLSALPTRPDALLARLRVDANAAGDDRRLFRAVLDILRAAPPPPLQAALYRVLSLTPGVRVLPRLTDELGRVADRVAVPLPEGEDELLFSATSGAFLGSRLVEPGSGKTLAYRLVRTVSLARTAPPGVGPAAAPLATHGPGRIVPGATQPASSVH